MTIMRAAEFIVHQGKGPQVMASAREMQELIAADGGNLNFYQLLSGGVPGTMVATSVLDDLDSYGAVSDKINNNPQWAAWMGNQAKQEGFPLSTPVNVSVLQDLHDEVGEPSGVTPNPSIVIVYRQRLAAGKRDAFIAMSKGVRAAMKDAGRPVGWAMQCLIGDVSMVTRSMGYESVSAWAEAQKAGWPPAVMDLVRKAQADGPLFDSIECRMLRNVTPA